MSEEHLFIDGRALLTTTPLRSKAFLFITAVGSVAVVLDAYIIFRYYQILPAVVSSALACLVGVQLIYQWWRALRYYSKVRRLYAEQVRSGSVGHNYRDAALETALVGIADLLFYSYAIMLVTLVVLVRALARAY